MLVFSGPAAHHGRGMIHVLRPWLPWGVLHHVCKILLFRNCNGMFVWPSNELECGIHIIHDYIILHILQQFRVFLQPFDVLLLPLKFDCLFSKSSGSLSEQSWAIVKCWNRGVFLQYCRSLQFSEKPNYDFLHLANHRWLRVCWQWPCQLRSAACFFDGHIFVQKSQV